MEMVIAFFSSFASLPGAMMRTSCHLSNLQFSQECQLRVFYFLISQKQRDWCSPVNDRPFGQSDLPSRGYAHVVFQENVYVRTQANLREST